jgi:hypothetical protein
MRRLLATSLIFLAVCSTLAQDSEPSEEKFQANQHLSRELDRYLKGVTQDLDEILENYDLCWRSRIARKTVTKEIEFRRLLETRGLEKEKIAPEVLNQLVLEYWASSGRVVPEVAAWFALEINTPSSWSAALPHYEQIRQVRPRDIEPRILLLIKSPTNETECQEWFTMVKEAYKLGENEPEKVYCVLIASVSTMGFGTNTFAESVIEDFNYWLQNLDLTGKPASFIKRIRIGRALVATSTGDIDKALSNSKNTPLFSLMPLWLMSLGEWERALQVVYEGKKSPDLDAETQEMLRVFQKILEEITQKRIHDAKK